MQRQKFMLVLLIALCAIGLASFATVQAAPPDQAASTSLTVLNPQGTVPVVGKFAPRLSTLDGKKVGLWLMLPSTFEFQPAGVAFYDEIAAMMKKQFPTVTIVMPKDFSSNAPEVTSTKAITETKVDAAVLGIGG
jgi:hypothetical protein